MSGAAPAPLCVIAGAGSLPLQVVAAARKAGRPVFVAVLKGHADPADFSAFDTEIFGLGQLGHLLKAMRARGVAEACLIGKVERPTFADIKPDFGLLKHLPSLAGAFGKGDDGLLKGVIHILESEGLTIRSAAELLAEGAVVSARGPLGRLTPDTDAAQAIAMGLTVLEALSPFDIGQAVVVADGRVVAVEGIEGTDAMLRRVAEMRALGRLSPGPGGVLVKAPKTGQDLRVDMPTIGPPTIHGAKAAGLAGVAISARTALIAEQPATIALADELGLFIEAT